MHIWLFATYVYLGTSLITWNSKKQETVSRSSTEAEYWNIALACELLWWVQLFCDFKVHVTALMKLSCYNKSAIHIVSNPIFYERTKHVEIDYYIMRDQLKRRFLKLFQLSSSNQHVIIITKALYP